MLVNVKFTVEGAGTFPLDMLRYDACHPYSENDAYVALDRATGGQRQVTCLRRAVHMHWQPTAGRWESFGWKVIAIAASPAD